MTVSTIAIPFNSVRSTTNPIPSPQLGERLARLQDSCELLADGFEGLDDLIALYVASTPMPGGDVGCADADQFLDWLEDRTDLNDEQRDFIAALRGRHAIELVAVKQRLAHARFQELVTHAASRVDELETNARMTIHLNPIHVWSQFETHALLEHDTEVPATVLFVPIGSQVRTVVIEPNDEAILHDLEAAGPVRLRDLLRRTPRHLRSECLDVIRKLAGVGVVGLSPQ